MNALNQHETPATRRANPFFHRGPIRDPAYFFGRRREVRLLLELVRNAQSVSVLGQRKIGKTSLLFYVSHPAVLRRHGLSGDRYAFIYVDCQGRGDLTHGDFCQLLLRDLVSSLGDQAPFGDLLRKERPSLAAVEDGVQRAIELGRRPVFLLDEFEAMAANRHLGPGFFFSLRRIAAEHPVAYVTTTKLPLLALAGSNGSVLSSPFFNIFQPVRLGLFSVEEAQETLQGLAARAEVTFPGELVDFLLDLAGLHPFLLQVVGFYAFELLETRGGALDAADHRLIRERFWATAEQHFQYYWSHLDDEARYVLATLSLTPATATDALAGLEEACLIVRRGEGFGYLSSTLRDFVRSQQVNGLVQVGPFVVDENKQSVILDAQSLDLTPTQYTLLVYLLGRPGQVARYDELEENVWGDAYTGDPERLKAAVKHLRRALGDRAGHIANVRGVGYMFEPSPETIGSSG